MMSNLAYLKANSTYRYFSISHLRLVSKMVSSEELEAICESFREWFVGSPPFVAQTRDEAHALYISHFAPFVRQALYFPFAAHEAAASQRCAICGEDFRDGVPEFRTGTLCEESKARDCVALNNDCSLPTMFPDHPAGRHVYHRECVVAGFFDRMKQGSGMGYGGNQTRINSIVVNRGALLEDFELDEGMNRFVLKDVHRRGCKSCISLIGGQSAEDVENRLCYLQACGFRANDGAPKEALLRLSEGTSSFFPMGGTIAVRDTFREEDAEAILSLAVPGTLIDFDGYRCRKLCVVEEEGAHETIKEVFLHAFSRWVDGTDCEGESMNQYRAMMVGKPSGSKQLTLLFPDAAWYAVLPPTVVRETGLAFYLWHPCSSLRHTICALVLPGPLSDECFYLHEHCIEEWQEACGGSHHKWNDDMHKNRLSDLNALVHPPVLSFLKEHVIPIMQPILAQVQSLRDRQKKLKRLAEEFDEKPTPQRSPGVLPADDEDKAEFFPQPGTYGYLWREIEDGLKGVETAWENIQHPSSGRIADLPNSIRRLINAEESLCFLDESVRRSQEKMEKGENTGGSSMFNGGMTLGGAGFFFGPSSFAIHQSSAEETNEQRAQKAKAERMMKASELRKAVFDEYCTLVGDFLFSLVDGHLSRNLVTIKLDSSASLAEARSSTVFFPAVRLSGGSVDCRVFDDAAVEKYGYRTLVFISSMCKVPLAIPVVGCTMKCSRHLVSLGPSYIACEHDVDLRSDVAERLDQISRQCTRIIEDTETVEGLSSEYHQRGKAVMAAMERRGLNEDDLSAVFYCESCHGIASTSSREQVLEWCNIARSYASFSPNFEMVQEGVFPCTS